MKRSRFLLAFIAVCAAVCLSAQGLGFNGSEVPIDNRTSYKVFDERAVMFSGVFDIEFNIALFPATKIGYITRIKNEKSKKIYNLFYDGNSAVNHLFRFNEEGKSSLITALISKEKLPESQWFKLKISFYLEGDSISLSVGEDEFHATKTGLPVTYYPVIFFGKNEMIVDVPSFAIRNLRVGNSRSFHFDFRENAGTRVHNYNGKPKGVVENPVWLINDSYRWRLETSFHSKTVAGANYNPRTKEIYYFNRDSIHIYNVKTKEKQTKIFNYRCPVPMRLGTNFVDTEQNKLYAYEVFYEPQFHSDTAMASYDLRTNEWRVETAACLPLQLHHHSSYFDTKNGVYIIFGGFGNMRYNKTFYTFDIHTKFWTALDSLAGDVIFPRYFQSMGYDEKENSLYVFGGMGNESGEQVVGRRYFYDLHRIDLNAKTVTKLWETEWNADNVVPVRSMAIPRGDSCFYTLCYPEHFSKSFLHLYCFSIKDGSREILGDSIPISSDRITTNANLYFDEDLKKLYAVVQEFAHDDVASDVKIYSLNFPPVTASQLAAVSDYFWEKTILIIVAIVIIGFVILILVFRKKNRWKKEKAQQQMQELMLSLDEKREKRQRAEPEYRANSIYLFGDFMVRDRQNRDITYMFSPRLKQVFCIILQYTYKQGITQNRLSNLIWSDKTSENAKNLRGVTINHLRKVLKEIDGCELEYNNGIFSLLFDPVFYCDYARFHEIVLLAERTKEQNEELLEIVLRGKFLNFSDSYLFDNFKESTEQKLEPMLSVELEKSFSAGKYCDTIYFAESLFNIDPVSEMALIYRTKALVCLGKKEEALIKYKGFATEYKTMTGHNYAKRFEQFL